MKSKESFKHYGGKFKEKYLPGSGVIGKVLPLGPGSVNPMWQIEKNLPSIAKRAARILKATQPKKKERTTIVVNQGVVIGVKSQIEMDEDMII